MKVVFTLTFTMLMDYCIHTFFRNLSSNLSIPIFNEVGDIVSIYVQETGVLLKNCVITARDGDYTRYEYVGEHTNIKLVIEANGLNIKNISKIS